MFSAVDGARRQSCKNFLFAHDHCASTIYRNFRRGNRSAPMHQPHPRAIDCSSRRTTATPNCSQNDAGSAPHWRRACIPAHQDRHVIGVPKTRLRGFFLRLCLLGAPTLAADTRHMIAIAAHCLATLAASFTCFVAGKFVRISAGMRCLSAAASQHTALFGIQCGKAAPATSTVL